MSDPFRVGLLGHGTVGSAFAALLDERAEAIATATGRRPEIGGILTRSKGNFDEILARTMAHNPTRSESSLRRGILHNAVQRDDGSWVWRYARFRATDAGGERGSFIDRIGDLWAVVSGLQMPAGRECQPLEADHRVAPPVGEPVVAGDDRPHLVA